MIRPLLLCLLLSSPALAGPVDGTWDISAEACANPASDARITIGGGEMVFHESSCTMANETPVPGMTQAWFYDLTCQGEGETWGERAILGLVFQGVEMIYLSDTVGFQVVRCD